MKLYLPSESELLAFARELYGVIVPGMLVFLHGPLGAGKTSLVRGCLFAAGYTGKVKSPTYTLVEEYRLANRLIFHFDLYRLNDPEELEAMGIRDYFNSEATCFMEWAERGAGVLPSPDFEIKLSVTSPGRDLEIFGVSKSARDNIQALEKIIERLAR